MKLVKQREGKEATGSFDTVLVNLCRRDTALEVDLRGVFKFMF